MPIYESYEKDSDIIDEDDIETEMVEGQGQEKEIL